MCRLSRHGGTSHRSGSRALAEEVGFPLIIKAASAVVDAACAWSTTRHAFDARSTKPKKRVAAFGNGAVFLERYVRRAKHIEVQILGDSTATWCICMSATAPCSAATKRWWKSRPRSTLTRACAKACADAAVGSRAKPAITTPAQSNFWSMPTPASGSSSKSTPAFRWSTRSPR